MAVNQHAFTWRMPATLLMALIMSLPGVAFAQNVRHGKIAEIRSIENKGEDTSEKHKMAEKIGSAGGKIGGMLAGLGMSSKHGKDLGTVGAVTAPYVGAYAGDYLGKAIAGKIVDVGPSVRYMLKIEFDDHSKVAVARPSDEIAGMKQGDRVVVTGTGSDMTVAAE